MKKFKKFLSVLLTLSLIFSLSAVGVSGSAAPDDDSKNLVVYFSNWGDDEAEDLPWDRLSYINHAFWEINPVEGQENTYEIASTDPDTDFVDTEDSKSLFTQYAEMSETYPDVNVMISIGGWTRCGYFSEMANTAEGRQSFIDSCIETMNTYPFIDGIDIDWEYPGVERAGDGTTDEGCPVVGDDYNNYTALIKEMREAFDAEYGVGSKKLTACSSVNQNTLAKQDVAAIAPYLDLINIMSYDMTGSYDPVTGHHTALTPTDSDSFSAVSGVNYFLDKGVSPSKLNIGSPLYCHGWGGVTPDEDGNVVGVAGSADGYPGDLNWNVVKAIELKAVEVGTPGWHKGYDQAADAAYLWNDNPDSKYYQVFLTYESEESLQAKIDYINSLGLAGLIVWEAAGDSAVDEYPMLTQMAKGLGLYDGEQTVYGQAGQIPEIDETRPSASYPDPMTETVAGYGSIAFPYGTYIYYKSAMWMSINDNSNDWVDNLPDGAWGASCWQKVFDVKDYVSQADLGYWDWAADAGEYVFYDPDKDNTGGIYLATAQTSNTANDAPDGIWGTNWKYVTTVTRVASANPDEYQPKYADGAKEETLLADPDFYGEFSPAPFEKDGVTIDTYPAGSIVTYNGKYYEAYKDSSAWNDGWEPDVHPNWHEITIIEEYKPKYANPTLESIVKADPDFYGEFQTRPFEKDGVTVDTYPAGSVVSYNGKYYEAYENSSVWDAGWEPDVHPNWHEITLINVQRLAGSTRYETAIAISDDGWESADTVILANGTNYADALAGVPLAYKLNAPILLTQNWGDIESNVAAQIEELGASKVIILGGYKVISQQIEDTLSEKYTVERIKGSTRYDTAVEISKRVSENPETAIVVTGTGYADALSISPYAALKGYPIVYANPETGLTDSTVDYLASAQDIIIAGGFKVVCENTVAQLEGKNIDRIYGSTRYLTSYEIANKFSSEFGNDVMLATGTSFPDALAGGVLAAKLKTPLLLTDTPAVISEIKNYILDKSPSNIYVLGGEKIMPTSIVENIYA